MNPMSDVEMREKMFGQIGRWTACRCSQAKLWDHEWLGMDLCEESEDPPLKNTGTFKLTTSPGIYQCKYLVEFQRVELKHLEMITLFGFVSLTSTARLAAIHHCQSEIIQLSISKTSDHPQNASHKALE